MCTKILRLLHFHLHCKSQAFTPTTVNLWQIKHIIAFNEPSDHARNRNSRWNLVNQRRINLWSSFWTYFLFFVPAYIGPQTQCERPDHMFVGGFCFIGPHRIYSICWPFTMFKIGYCDPNQIRRWYRWKQQNHK